MIFAGNMARACFFADALADGLRQGIVEVNVFAKLHEQHDANIAFPALADDDRLDDIGNLFDRAVDLGGADANPTRD